jgi:hypothetical protein
MSLESARKLTRAGNAMKGEGEWGQGCYLYSSACVDYEEVATAAVELLKKARAEMEIDLCGDEECPSCMDREKLIVEIEEFLSLAKGESKGGDGVG